jgi:hypothetical protein
MGMYVFRNFAMQWGKIMSFKKNQILRFGTFKAHYIKTLNSIIGHLGM